MQKKKKNTEEWAHLLTSWEEKNVKARGAHCKKARGSRHFPIRQFIKKSQIFNLIFKKKVNLF